MMLRTTLNPSQLNGTANRRKADDKEGRTVSREPCEQIVIRLMPAREDKWSIELFADRKWGVQRRLAVEMIVLPQHDYLLHPRETETLTVAMASQRAKHVMDKGRLIFEDAFLFKYAAEALAELKLAEYEAELTQRLERIKKWRAALTS